MKAGGGIRARDALRTSDDLKARDAMMASDSAPQAHVFRAPSSSRARAARSASNTGAQIS